MFHARLVGFGVRRAAGIVAVVVTFTLFLVPSAFGQTNGEAHIVAIRGGDSAFRFGGFAGGAGVLFQNRVGVDGEFGLVGDNSAERVLAPALSAGGSLHFPTQQASRTLVPFIAGGFTRFGDSGGWYLGGGADYWVRRTMAVRVEFRGTVPTLDYSICPMNSRNECASSRKAWFLRAGLTFGAAR